MEMKLKLCRNVHNISFYKNYVLYCRCSCAFVAMAAYSFHRLLMGKVKVGLYCYISHCRYFDTSFSEMFFGYSTKHMNFFQTAEFDWFAWQPKCKICEKILKNHLLRSHNGDEAETLQKCS